MDHRGQPPEPVRSRWAPKPEQIQILESIFRSGTVNPSKGETVMIRKIIEQYGSVGDANVFYWFQNRRSRCRRRQRQLQAAAAAAATDAAAGTSSTSPVSSAPSSSSSPGFNIADDSYGDDLFAISRQMGYRENMYAPQLPPLSETMTVFINGGPAEVPIAPFDMRSMFGQDVVLVHSSGDLLPVNEHGHLLQSLQMGESYFLVSSPTN